MVKNVQNTMDVVYEYLGLPPHVLEDTNARNARVGGYKVDFNNDCFRHLRSVMMINHDVDHRKTLFLIIGNAKRQ